MFSLTASDVGVDLESKTRKKKTWHSKQQNKSKSTCTALHDYIDARDAFCESKVRVAMPLANAGVGDGGLVSKAKLKKHHASNKLLAKSNTS